MFLLMIIAHNGLFILKMSHLFKTITSLGTNKTNRNLLEMVLLNNKHKNNVTFVYEYYDKTNHHDEKCKYILKFFGINCFCLGFTASCC